uniref:L domain-like protein n=1 Tax=Arcella intermedia TaxID=1963864 RepID=A0A6B2L0C1_9EUKA
MQNIDIRSPVTGTIPSYIYRFPLASLHLEGTLLEGTISSLIGSISALHNLAVVNNPLLSGTIPFEIGCGCKDLAVIQFVRNDKISGTLPPQIGLLKRLSHLVFHGNGISGTIPMEYGFTENRFDEDYQWCIHTPPNYNNNVTSLDTITISSQPGIIGTIPPELFQLPISVIELSENSLKGSVPVESIVSPTIRYIYLQNNQIGGTIPYYNGTHIIRTLNLSNNKISGTIPPELVKRIEDFEAVNNQLTGPLPVEPSRAIFFLAGNNLNGTIPYEYCSHDFSQINFGGNFIGCWYNCKPLRLFNSSVLCDLKGSTFGCNSQCGAPPGCGASCNAMYNSYPYDYPTLQGPSTPSLPSPPSIHSPSSLVDFINTEVNITKPKWTALNSTNSTINILNITNNVVIVNITGNWTDQSSYINAEGVIILNANSINFQSSNINLNNANLNINTGKFYFVGNLIMTLNSTVLMNGECADFSNSNLFVKVPEDFYGTSNETILVNATNNCLNLFKSVQGVGSGCQEVNIKQKNHGSAIGISFTVTYHCESSLSVATIAATVSCAFVALGVLVLVFAHPKIKKKVLPFHGRKAHTPYTNPEE